MYVRREVGGRGGLRDTKIEGLWDGTKNPGEFAELSFMSCFTCSFGGCADYGWTTTVPVEGETLGTGKVIRFYAENAVKFSHYVCLVS